MMHDGSEDHRLASGKASRTEKKKPKSANHIGQIRLVTLQVWSAITVRYSTVILVFESGPRKSIDFDSLAWANQDLDWISRM